MSARSPTSAWQAGAGRDNPGVGPSVLALWFPTDFRSVQGGLELVLKEHSPNSGSGWLLTGALRVGSVKAARSG